MLGKKRARKLGSVIKPAEPAAPKPMLRLPAQATVDANNTSIEQLIGKNWVTMYHAVLESSYGDV